MRRPKAADISDAAMLRAIHEQCLKHDMWALVWNLAREDFPDLPEKVVLAKVRQLIKRRLVNGCGCGCRGDLELEPIACDMIGVESWRKPWWPNPNYGCQESSAEQV